MAKYFSVLILATVVVIGLAMLGDAEAKAVRPSNRFFWLRPGAMPWIPINIPRPQQPKPNPPTEQKDPSKEDPSKEDPSKEDPSKEDPKKEDPEKKE